jgi:hypothetical protein
MVRNDKNFLATRTLVFRNVKEFLCSACDRRLLVSLKPTAGYSPIFDPLHRHNSFKV